MVHAENEMTGQAINKDIRLLGMATLLERFIFHAIRSLLIIYCIHELCFDKSYSYHVVAAFMALSLTTPIFGGILADKVFGYSKSLIIGSVIIFIASVCCLLFPQSLFIGLSLLAVGSGFIKSNVTSLLSVLSHQTKKNVFSYYFMMLNVGAFAAPILCATVGEVFGWTYCFIILTACSVLSIFFSLAIHRRQSSPTRPPLADKSLIASALTVLSCVIIYGLMQNKTFTDLFMIGCICLVLGAFGNFLFKSFSDFKAIAIVLIILVFNTLYWALYEQVGSTVNVFTAEYVNRDFAGIIVPITFFQSIPSFFVIVLTPLMNWIWNTLENNNINLGGYNKFGIGFLITGVSYLMLYLIIDPSSNSQLMGLEWLISFYLVLTVGELCIAPVGLSILSSVTPKAIRAMVMGVYQFSAALSNWVVGLLALEFVNDEIDSLIGFSGLFAELVQVGFVSGIVMIVLFSFLQKRLPSIAVR